MRSETSKRSLAPSLVAVYIVLVVSVFSIGFLHYLETIRRQSAIETASTFLESIAALHSYYSKEIVKRAEAAGSEFAYNYKEYDDKIPFPGTVAMDFGEELRKVDPRLNFSLYSENPFPWRKERELDEFEREALEFLKQYPEQKFIKFSKVNGRDTLRFAVGVKMKASCVECHNRPNFHLGRSWEVGDFRGVRQVSVPLPTEEAIPKTTFTMAILAILALGGVGMGLVLPLVHRLDEAQQEVSDQYLLIRDMIEAGSNGFFLTDTELNIVLVNTAMGEILDFPSEELKERNLREFYSSTEEFKEHLHLRFSPEAPPKLGRYEASFLLANGDSVPVFGTTALVKTTTGKLKGYLGIVREATEEKKAEERLRQAQRMEAVGQLTGGIAHDFNNLLTIIMGSAGLLSEVAPQEDELVKEIIGSAQRGADLTQRLLAFSRKQPLRSVPVDLSEVSQGMSTILKRTLGESIELAFHSEEKLWTAFADPRQVEDALLNLAINAQKSMPRGGKLTIECSNVVLEAEDDELEQEELRSYVLLRVQDTGCGMTEEVRSRAFEPFFTTRGVGEGSGLGLSMVYGFAKQSGGFVRLHSSPGEGTSVELYLPRWESKSGSEAEPKKP